MLALRLWICWCVPKQWQNLHLGDVNIQNLQSLITAVVRVQSAPVQKHESTERIICASRHRLQNVSDTFEFYKQCYILKQYGGESVRYWGKLGFTSSTALAELWFRQNAIGYFEKGEGLLDISRSIFLFHCKLRQQWIKLHFPRHFSGPLSCPYNYEWMNEWMNERTRNIYANKQLY